MAVWERAAAWEMAGVALEAWGSAAASMAAWMAEGGAVWAWERVEGGAAATVWAALEKGGAAGSVLEWGGVAWAAAGEAASWAGVGGVVVVGRRQRQLRMPSARLLLPGSASPHHAWNGAWLSVSIGVQCRMQRGMCSYRGLRVRRGTTREHLL